MTDLQDDTDLAAREAGQDDRAPLAGTGSMLDRLREQRQAVGDDLDTIIDVPGQNHLLAVRYQLLHFRRANQLGKQLLNESNPDVQLNFAADFLAEACLEVLVRDPETDELQPIDPGHGPTKFDGHLLALFEIPAAPGLRPRDVVKLVFNRDFAVMDTYDQLARWMTKTNSEVNEEFSGK